MVQTITCVAAICEGYVHRTLHAQQGPPPQSVVLVCLQSSGNIDRCESTTFIVPLQMHCRSSDRILNLTLLVMGYGTAHKLFGFVWKGQMKLLYPSASAYATVMSDVAAFTGAATVGLMLVSKYFFQVG